MNLKAMQRGRVSLQMKVGLLCSTATIHISSVSERYFRDAFRKHQFVSDAKHSQHVSKLDKVMGKQGTY